MRARVCKIENIIEDYGANFLKSEFVYCSDCLTVMTSFKFKLSFPRTKLVETLVVSYMDAVLLGITIILTSLAVIFPCGTTG